MQPLPPPGHVGESAALSLLARHYVDRDAAFLTFGDPSILQRDALSDAGAQYLHDLLPQPVEGMCSVLERTGTNAWSSAGTVIQHRQPIQGMGPVLGSSDRHTPSQYDRYRSHMLLIDSKA